MLILFLKKLTFQIIELMWRILLNFIFQFDQDERQRRNNVVLQTWIAQFLQFIFWFSLYLISQYFQECIEALVEIIHFEHILRHLIWFNHLWLFCCLKILAKQKLRTLLSTSAKHLVWCLLYAVLFVDLLRKYMISVESSLRQFNRKYQTLYN